MAEKGKIIKGQFFTKNSTWLKHQVIDFIRQSNCSIAYDPFAGNGDLIKCSESYGIINTIGLDIDASLGWKYNDSLVGIPPIEDAIIITNPPYLSNYSARRKKIYSEVENYFSQSQYDDLYMIALDKMLEVQSFVVAIIPETFINSNYQRKSRLHSITVLEDNPFHDTDTPVCVACFDKIDKPFSDIHIFKNDTFVFSYETLNSFRIRPTNCVKITFNTLEGWLGLRAVDTTNPKEMIRFDFKELFNYDWNKGIKNSSRLLSTIDIRIKDSDKQLFIDKCNSILSDLRDETSDLVFSPFKGNMKNGIRRRRLDYYTARAIMEQAYRMIYGGADDADGQFSFF